MSWIYKGRNITSIKDIEEIIGYIPYGFVYNIVANNGREYIGQKQLCTVRSKVAGKRALAKKGKSAFRRRKNKKTGNWIYYEEIVKESNWKDYTGSNSKLNEDIKNGINYTKYILRFVKDKGSMLYEETKEIICTGALEDERFYNDHVLGKFYKRNIINKNE